MTFTCLHSRMQCIGDTAAVEAGLSGETTAIGSSSLASQRILTCIPSDPACLVGSTITHLAQGDNFDIFHCKSSLEGPCGVPRDPALIVFVVL